jgi:Na+/citrate or Na+/malate symporter
MKTILNVAVFFLSALLTIWTMLSGWGLTAKSWPVIISAVLFQFVLVCVHANVNAKNDSLPAQPAS